MAAVPKITDLEARKRALVTESEICRETLKIEVDNLRLYAAGFRNRFEQVRNFGPLLLLAVPLVGFLFGKRAQAPRASGLKGGIATALLGLRLYRKYGPLLRTLFAQFVAKKRTASEARAPA